MWLWLLTNRAKQGYVEIFYATKQCLIYVKPLPYQVHIILLETYLVLTFLRMPSLSHNEMEHFDLNTLGEGEPTRFEFI